MFHTVKSLLYAAKLSLDIIAFLALMIALLWLLNPFIPGVHLHGFWDFLLSALGMLGFYEIAKWVHKGKKKDSVQTL